MARLSVRLDALLCLTLVTLSGAQVYAQSSRSPAVSGEPDLRAQLGQKAPQWLKQYDVPSVAVAYIENGKLAWTEIGRAHV